MPHELKIGSSDANSGGEVTPFQQWFKRYASSYAPPVDGYIGTNDAAAIKLLQSKLGIVADGVFGDRTAAKVGYKWKDTGAVPIVETRRPIWIYTAPGSGAKWWVGPSFELGNRAKDILKINHQPLEFQMGGYLGFMGGDPTFSYNEVIFDQYLSLKWCLEHNPDVTAAMEKRSQDPKARVDIELWFSGYSQSADGMEEAIIKLFGDDGPFEVLRDRINGIIQFGNPSTKTTGIARKTRPGWVYKLVTNINKPNDFYAIVPASDTIRPAMYKVIVEADMGLPFFVHILQIAVPVMLNFVPIFGGLLGPLAVPMVAGMTGLNTMMPLLGGLMGQAASGEDAHTHDDLVEMLSITGMIKNLPGLIGLVAALPGLQAHGSYGGPDIDNAYDVMARFRR